LAAFWSIRGCSISVGARHEELYLSSADWMNRNMLRRVELAWPVTDPACASASSTNAWWLDCTMAATPGTWARWHLPSWLDRQLPEATRILCSPARRCEQTALALGRKYKIKPELAPDGTPEQLLEAALWPASRVPVVIVGHQPTLGSAVAYLLAMQHGSCPVRKGAVWWIRNRERDGHAQTMVVTVQSPDSL
jgi:phosphohistidine phosphatase